jgi:hypothetical protein
VEHNSGYGHFSTYLASNYPQATVVSIEPDSAKVTYHTQLLNSLNISNNAVCLRTASAMSVFRNVYECPELFRYQFISRGLEDIFVYNAEGVDATDNGRATDAHNYDIYGEAVGDLLSSAMTTFVYVPTAAQVSMSIFVLFILTGQMHALRSLTDVFGANEHGKQTPEINDDLNIQGALKLSSHPHPNFLEFQTQYLLQYARATGGHTQVSVSPVYNGPVQNGATAAGEGAGHALPLVRVDVINMTRHVHHHYDYSRDGHTRTYTMKVSLNNSVTAQTLQQLSVLGRSFVHDVSTQTLSLQTDEGIRLSVRRTNQPTLDARMHSGSLTADLPGGDSWLLPPGFHANNHHITSVHLLRDRDDFPIPYTSLHAITFITLLRLGLSSVQRDKFFEKFLKLPLYEDMAPWNIVLMGPVGIFCCW